MQKQVVEYWPQNSMEHVATHGAWQHSRGRQPSEPYLDIRNPREAYAQALSDLALSGETVITLSQEIDQIPSQPGIERALILVNTEYNMAQRAYKAAVERRNCIILLATKVGETRQTIADTIGLSRGRVQQIVDGM
jgi:hypothetical protein